MLTSDTAPALRGGAALMRLGHASACAAAVWLCACAGDSANNGRNDGNTPGTRVAGNGGTSAAGTSGGSGFGGNPMQGMSNMHMPVAGSNAMSMMTPQGPSDPVFIDGCGADNPAKLSPEDVQKLQAGASPGSLRMLYPYDGTVFPRGILSPLLMWDGVEGATAVYVHIKSRAFEYKGCLAPSAEGQLQLPVEVWDKEGEQTYGGGDPAAVEISLLGGGTVTGPAKLQWSIAQATVKGSIFYNSYTSLLPGGMALGGSVLRIPPGGTAERFLSTDCNGCHSVSANGSRLLAQINLVNQSQSYQLTPDIMPNPPAMASGPRGSFGALYPDGSVYLSTSVAIEIARAALSQGLGAPIDATLYQTDSGTIVPDTGIPGGALMPTFSPDGKLLVFNDFAIDNAHGLALMDFDGPNRKASNHRVLFMETDMTMRPGWPFVLPDDGAVVFTRTNGGDFSGEGAGLAGLPLGPISDLHTVDLKTKTVLLLARAMGFLDAKQTGDDKTYLPFGVEDLHKNYFPTVSPVAAGGFFWVFFDSVRHYGNLGQQRQLWGAALEIASDGNYAIDRSHPAFYLPGQEFGTGNHRAFAALDPCKMDGDSCTSGIDCCGGFCNVPENPEDEFGTELAGTCTSNVPECSKTNERCKADADCCPPEDGKLPNTCIAGFCAVVIPVL